ncbi:hypothetical protein Daesc_006340 [Daldinia eschscholtzii]|uniref:Translation initiation factor IF-3 n=1 Tax=Daldinia eschscholtzii TaxID=292717 RepID=A0AAX6MGT2_9PEZI
MAHLACSSPARALHRVLVSNLPPRTPSYLYLIPPRLFFSFSSSSSSSSSFSSRRLLRNSRNATNSLSPAPAPGHARTLSTTRPLRRIDPLQKYPSNENIPYDYVRVVGQVIPEEEGGSTLGPAQPIDSVLRTLDRKTHALIMVAPPPAAADPDTLDASAAICRIIDKAAAKAAAIEAEQRARRKAIDTKELEFSWGISPHDLGHKLRRLRQFLDQGLSVEVILARKRGGKPVPVETAEEVLKAVRAALKDVEGAKESRKMDGKVGGIVRLYFEGPSEKKKAKKKKEKEEKEREREREDREDE